MRLCSSAVLLVCVAIRLGSRLWSCSSLPGWRCENEVLLLLLLLLLHSRRPRVSWVAWRELCIGLGR